MADAPGQSLPKQCSSWGDLKAAYRLLNQPRIAPAQLTAVHRRRTRERAAALPVVLCVQDTMDADYTHRSAVRGLGPIGNGRGWGFRQHSGLAVSEDGQVHGILEQRWFVPAAAPKGETLRQRQSRWNEPDVWGEVAEALDVWPAGSRLIHVGDRHSDVFRFLATCRRLGHGFVVRAMHDRCLAEGGHLWARLSVESVGLVETVEVATQRTAHNRVRRRARTARVEVRWAAIQLPAPQHDPRTAGEAPLAVWAVHAVEPAPPPDVEPLEWMLLSSEPVTCVADAQRCLGRYRCRWKIEEWHRALKEGCRLEWSQLDDVADLQRLAAMLSVVAVRMLQLRDLAEGPGRDSPAVLQATAPALWIAVVARLAGQEPQALTVRQFVWTIARRGGFLGRKGDGRPGWKTLWQGWYDIQRMVEGVELMHPP